MMKINLNYLRDWFGSTNQSASKMAPSDQRLGNHDAAMEADLKTELIVNPLETLQWHSLVLGSAGSGKTALMGELVGALNCDVIWFAGENSQFKSLQSCIEGKGRFELPVLLVVDDIHLFTEHLELIELVARDGLKSNVLLLVSAQLLSDLPQAVWRNCQIKFALGQDALDQLNQSVQNLSAFEALYLSPMGRGTLKLKNATQFQPAKSESSGNPLVRRASTPQLAPYEESALARQTPLDQWSKEVLAEPQDLRGHQLGSKDQPHRTRYSRTL